LSQNLSLYLASASPRRQELLTQLGVNFSIVEHDVDEVVRENESPEVYVERLAVEKANSGLQPDEVGIPVLGADTIVVCDGVILEKPKDKGDAAVMLKRLSGRSHQVLTAVALDNGNRKVSVVVSSTVWFGVVSDEDAARYWATGEPCDKAGGYGIQGLGGSFVSRIEGSYSAVVGLPIYETGQLLTQFSIPFWLTDYKDVISL